MILYADCAGERLDAFVARSVDGLSRSGAQKLLEEGCILLNVLAVFGNGSGTNQLNFATCQGRL